MDSNVMHRFMVQVQDALFCSSTFVLLEEISFVYSIGNQLLSQLAWVISRQPVRVPLFANLKNKYIYKPWKVLPA